MELVIALIPTNPPSLKLRRVIRHSVYTKFAVAYLNFAVVFVFYILRRRIKYSKKMRKSQTRKFCVITSFDALGDPEILLRPAKLRDYGGQVNSG